MDTTISASTCAKGALRSHALNALVKLDKNQFIASYIYGQKIHLKSYALEGRAISSTWNNQFPTQAGSSENNGLGVQASAQADCGFGTPILKARLEQNIQGTELRETSPKDISSLRSIHHREKEIETRRTKSHILPAAKSESRETGLSTSDKVKSIPSKRVTKGDSDEDRVTRLKDRRERKRAKRTAMNIPEVNDSEVGSEVTKKKSKHKKGKSAKISAGFALMHGFSATNVGKNRLTVKPVLNIGVFSKGKASTKHLVKNKKTKDVQFSEQLFLNNTSKELSKKKLQEEQSSTLSGSDAEIQSTSESLKSQHKASMKKSTRMQRSKSHQDMRIPSSSPTRQSTVSAEDELDMKVHGRNKAIAESVIWDIELEDPVPSEGVPVPIASEVGQGTAILNTRKMPWMGGLSLETCPVTKKDTFSPKALQCKDMAEDSYPPLYPSDSASQVNHTETKISKYFGTIERNTPIHSVFHTFNTVLPQGSSRSIISYADSTKDMELPLPPNHMLQLGAEALSKDGHVKYPTSQSIPQNRLQMYNAVDNFTDIHLRTTDYTPASMLASELPPDNVVAWSGFSDDELHISAQNETSDYYTFNNESYLQCSDANYFVLQVQDDVPWVDEELTPEIEFENIDEQDLESDYHHYENEHQATNIQYNESHECDDATSSEQQEFRLGDWQDTMFSTEMSSNGHQSKHGSGSPAMTFHVSGNDLSELSMASSDRASNDMTHQFSQGRALLLGLQDAETYHSCYMQNDVQQLVSNAEADVARILRNHWLPHKLS